MIVSELSEFYMSKLAFEYLMTISGIVFAIAFRDIVDVSSKIYTDAI